MTVLSRILVVIPALTAFAGCNEDDEPYLWFAVAFGVPLILCVLWYIRDRGNAAEAAESFRAAAASYQAALDYLAAHPEDPQARLVCLERGRLYYSMAVPDTYTLVVGTNEFGTQDYQNNTAGREARIAADIDARVGHLKFRGRS